MNVSVPSVLQCICLIIELLPWPVQDFSDMHNNHKAPPDPMHSPKCLKCKASEHIIIRYQLCCKLSVMWSHSPLSSCAQQQQQYRWRCASLSLSLSSTVMQEWCFNTVFREKKSQTPTPSCLTEPHCHPMRKKQHNSFTLHIPDEDDDVSIIFLDPPLCLTFFSYRLVYYNSFCIIAVICTHAYSNNLLYASYPVWFSHMNSLLLLITIFYHGSLVLKGHNRLCASEMTNYAVIC